MKLFLTVFFATLLLAGAAFGLGMTYYLHAQEQLEQQTVAPEVQELICLHYVTVDRLMLAGECRGI